MVEQVSSLKTGVKYKDTPIGKIPVDWELNSLGTIACLEYEASLPEKKRKGGNIPVYGSSGIVGYHSEAMVNGPGIIIGRKGTIGSANWVKKDFCPIDTSFYISKKQSKQYLKWLFYLLSNLHLERLNITTGVPGLNREEAQSVMVPIPPLCEQKKIAEILTTVDDEIHKTTQIIEKTKELKKGLMQRLLTRGIGHKKFKKTEIGKIPMEWDVGDISDYGEIITGNTPSTSVPQYYGKEYPFASPFDLGEKKTIIETEKYLSKDGLSAARALPPNSVLVVCIGSTIGKTGIAGKIVATNQQINSVVCKNSDFNFVYYYLTFISKKIKLLSSTQAVPIINKGEFSKIRTAILPIHEQKKIGDILSSIDNQREKESNHREQLNLLRKGLMQVLLTGKLRVAV